MCKFKVSWFGKQAQHCGVSAACSPAPLSSQAPGMLFCRLASRGTSAKFTLAQFSQICEPAPLMLCIWNSRLEELQLICSAQHSKAQSTRTASFLPKGEPSSSSSPLPAGGLRSAPAVEGDSWHSQLPQGVVLAEDTAGQHLFWPHKAERTSNVPMPEQGSSQLSQLHCGDSTSRGCTTSLPVSALRWELDVFTLPAQHLTRQRVW